MGREKRPHSRCRGARRALYKPFSAPPTRDYNRWGFQPQPNLHRADAWRGSRDGDNYYSFHAGRLEPDASGIYGNADWANVMGACDFIRGYDGDAPLCVYLPLSYPHPPYGVEEPFFSSADPTNLPPRIPAPTADMAHAAYAADTADAAHAVNAADAAHTANAAHAAHAADAAAGKPQILAALRDGQRLKGWDEERWTRLRATYYGMCNRIDHQLGLVVQALRDRGIFDDTALFFFSDHGDFTGDYGLVEKTQNTFEDVLTRVPLVIKPPRPNDGRPRRDAGTPGRISDALVELVDVSATIWDLTGIDPGYTHFGRSLMPLLEGTRTDHRAEVHCEGGRLRGETQAMERESLDTLADPAANPLLPAYSPSGVR